MSDLEVVRAEAIQRLCAAHAGDHIPLVVFEDRLERLRAADSEGTVAALVADIEPSGEWNSAAEDLPARLAAPSPLRIASYFSSTTRAGVWVVPDHLELQILFGSIRLDLRDADILSDLVEIEVSSTLGSFELVVPPGTAIDNEIHETLSSTSHKRKRSSGGYPTASPLLVRLTGHLLLSELVIKERPPAPVAVGGGGGRREWWRRLMPGA